MPIRLVRLGTARARHEGLRLGTVRRPPRGVPKSEHARQNFYDVWLPDLAPTADLVDAARSSDDDDARAWRQFERRYRAQMKKPPASRLLQLLAALSHHANFSVGCYCADERRCHRSILRQLLRDHGARLA